ncbi:hypothetical protein WA026_021054 [Henosepilachna vigintioctopunctata]|uniref:Uncharacterized protein n=1 Tax=Henosepilachna vigintioctopunctata TaxID=420089 RepID=A0AAW1V2I1_9CUCU
MKNNAIKSLDCILIRRLAIYLRAVVTSILHLGKKVQIISVYRPPSMKIDDFTTALDTLLDNCQQRAILQTTITDHYSIYVEFTCYGNEDHDIVTGKLKKYIDYGKLQSVLVNRGWEHLNSEMDVDRQWQVLWKHYKLLLKIAQK